MRGPPCESLYAGIHIEVDTAQRPPSMRMGVYLHDGFCGIDFVQMRLPAAAAAAPAEPGPHTDPEVALPIQSPVLHSAALSLSPSPPPGPRSVPAPACDSPPGGACAIGRRESRDRPPIQPGDQAASDGHLNVHLRGNGTEAADGATADSDSADDDADHGGDLDDDASQALYDRWVRPFEPTLLHYLEHLSHASPPVKVQAAGISATIDDLALCVSRHRAVFTSHGVPRRGNINATLTARLWLDLDILPIIVCTVEGSSIDERACSAVRKALLYLNPLLSPNIPRISVAFRHEVEVDGAGAIRLANLADYKHTVTDAVWSKLRRSCEKMLHKKLNIAFFNSTPVGGGVALMRNAVIRFLSMLGFDAHWYVTKPNPEVFQITKRKFHNVLQGVEAPDVTLTDADKQTYLAWCQRNAANSWADGPFREADVIIIDDPQLRNDLIEQPNTETRRVWDFLWSFIRHADGFVWHPIASTVPAVVPRDRLRFFPAFLDPLDGLCKPLSPFDADYYLDVFSRIAHDKTSRRFAFPHRPYILQISRFDPSKGIPDVLAAYARLRARIDAVVPFARLPQLVIAGIGAVDDPQGAVVYRSVLAMLEQESLADISSDILTVMLPPCDQILNALLASCKIYLQLSVREGFEIKVTEALHKGKPVIAYRSGGLALQVDPATNGFLIDPGDTDAVGDTLYTLLTDAEAMQRVIDGAAAHSNPHLTVASEWMDYIDELTSEPKS
nr:hypothetical protein HK105_003157 [Polyrhizophydium stewartii]